jgi:RHS repeat-associated protein
MHGIAVASHNPRDQRQAIAPYQGDLGFYSFDEQGQLNSETRADQSWCWTNGQAGTLVDMGNGWLLPYPSAGGSSVAASAALYSSNATPPVVSREIVMDGIGNREQYGVRRIVVNDLDQPVKIVNLSSGVVERVLQWDADGNLANDGRRVYSWDAANRLTQVTPVSTTSGLKRITHTYDGQSRRIKTIKESWSGSAWVGCETNRYIYDGWNLVRHISDTPTPPYSQTNFFAWGLDKAGQRTGEPGQGAGGIGGLLAMRTVGGGVAKLYLPVADANGNIVMVLDPGATNVVARFAYSAYGVLEKEWYADAATQSRLAAMPRFQSKLFDKDTGLYYYGHRWYDPELAVWISADPLGESGGRNLYAAMGGDPVNNVDPLGLDAVYVVLPPEKTEDAAEQALIKIFVGAAGLKTQSMKHPVVYIHANSIDLESTEFSLFCASLFLCGANA